MLQNQIKSNQCIQFISDLNFKNQVSVNKHQHWTTFVKNLFQELELKAKFELGVTHLKYVVDYGLRSSYTVAQWKAADHCKNHLRFNNYLFSQINDLSLIKDVVIHEFSHMLAYNIYGLNIEEHGDEWKLIMKKMGGQISPPSNKVFKSYKFKPSDRGAKCDCCRQFFISSQMANNIEEFGYVYLCPDCNSKIKLKG